MKYYALIYHVTEDYITRRAQYRDAHLALAASAADRGELLLGGAFSNPYDTALLVFYLHDPAVIEQFVLSDPYYQNGLVISWEVREWNVVAGCQKQ